MRVTREQIAASIRSLGVRAGDLMIAHSSFRSFNPADPADRVEGGPAAVAQGLIESVGPSGSVFVPTFNYGNDPWDPAAAPSYDGAITESFRRLAGAYRSNHPTHALAGIGPSAAEILAGHEHGQPFGRGSPCWKLWERDSWVLLIGVGHEASSVAHVAEELLQMPYLDRRRMVRVVGSGGKVQEIEVRRPGCSDGWNAVLDTPLRRAGWVRDTTVGHARFMLVRARAIVETTIQLLQGNPAALLCDNASCDACATARRMLHHSSRLSAPPTGSA